MQYVYVYLNFKVIENKTSSTKIENIRFNPASG